VNDRAGCNNGLAVYLVVIPSEGEESQSSRPRVRHCGLAPALQGLLTTEVTEDTENFDGWFVALRALCDLCG